MRAVLSPAAYRSAWEHLDLGAMPIVLYVEEPGSPADLAEHMQGNELDAWLVAALKLIATPPLAIDLRLGFGSTAIRALAAGTVLAVLTRDTMTISEIEEPVDALVGLLTVRGELVRAQFGAAVVDADGRRRRAAEVVDWSSAEVRTSAEAASNSAEGVTHEALKARIGAMLDTIRSIVGSRDQGGWPS